MEIPLKTLFLTAWLLVCASTAFAQQGTTDIDWRSLLVGGRVTAPLTLGERVQAESDSLAASSESALAAAKSQYLQYQTDLKNENEARSRVLLARRRQSDLALEKDRALDEMRRGFFCRACRRTKSQVEADGEDWQHHLDVNSQGRAVSATPQEPAAKALEFDSKINQAKADESRANFQADVAAQAKATAAQNVIKSFAPWKAAMLTEDDGRATAWDGAIKTYKARFDSYQKQIQELDVKIAKAQANELKSQDAQDLALQKDQVTAFMHQLAKDAQEDYFRRRMQEVTFEQRLTSGRKQLEQFVQDVGGPPLSTMSSFTSNLTSLPQLNAPLPTGGGGFTIGGGTLGLSLSAGLFKASLQASEGFLRDKLNVDVVLGFGPYGVGIRQSTDWSGSNGASITTTPIVSGPKPVEAADPLELMRDQKGDQKR